MTLWSVTFDVKNPLYRLAVANLGRRSTNNRKQIIFVSRSFFGNPLPISHEVKPYVSIQYTHSRTIAIMGKKQNSDNEQVKPEATAEQKAAVVKAAKKLLKKNSSLDEPMKIKNLVEMVCKKVTGASSEQVKFIIENSSKFEQVDKKKISLKRKRSKDDSSSSDGPSKISKKNDNDNKGQEISDSSIDSWREEQRIVLVRNSADATKQLSKDPTFFPARSFDDCRESIDASLVKQCVSGNGFQKPSPIQAQSWPILTKGLDVVGIAETGSGKTLAFALPALTRLAKGKRSGRRGSSTPRMLVLAPTRELAMQSETVLKEFGAVLGLETLCVYGGVPKYTQVSILKKGKVDCLVAPPGRLKDLIQEGSCDLSANEFLVLDEADRMLVSSLWSTCSCALFLRVSSQSFLFLAFLGHGI